MSKEIILLKFVVKSILMKLLLFSHLKRLEMSVENNWLQSKLLTRNNDTIRLIFRKDFQL